MFSTCTKRERTVFRGQRREIKRDRRRARTRAREKRGEKSENT